MRFSIKFLVLFLNIENLIFVHENNTKETMIKLKLHNLKGK